MKAFAWILTAAAVLVGADVFVVSSDPSAQPAETSLEQPMGLHGGNGMPPPPPDGE